MQATGFLRDIWTGLGGSGDALADVAFEGEGSLPSVFAVSDLATASVAAAALAVANVAGSPRPKVRVDRRLASLWFGTSFRPDGWTPPPAWDPVAGDYQAADGWIRLHTNAPRHRAAALAALGVEPDRDAVQGAVRAWKAEALEAEVVARGGCAAAMRSLADWRAHAQGRAVTTEPLAWTEITGGGGRSRVPPDPSRPLAGVRVLDLTRVLAGPTATRFLAGFGAEVLRIDPPDWDEPALEPDVTLGKACARLDLKGPSGRERLLALLAETDVLVHGYRPGALDGLGLDPATRRRVRPGLVDVCLDAYGWTGPWAGRRGFDSLVQMSAGIAHRGMVQAGADRPVPLPVQALDHATGYTVAAAVALGLARDRGSQTRVSLARTAALLAGSAADAGEDGGGALGKPRDADYAEGREATVWGPLMRLRPPASVGAAVMRWDRAAGPLGASLPAWPGSA